MKVATWNIQCVTPRFRESRHVVQTALSVAREPEGAALTEWPGVKHLTPRESEAYQRTFRAVAQRMRVAPVHLDAWYWGGDRS